MLVYVEVWAGAMKAEDRVHIDGLLTGAVAGIAT